MSLAICAVPHNFTQWPSALLAGFEPGHPCRRETLNQEQFVVGATRRECAAIPLKIRLTSWKPNKSR